MPDFDWSLGEDADSAAAETTPSERGAQLAETNNLDVQGQLEQTAQKDDHADDGDAQTRQRDGQGRFTSAKADAADDGVEAKDEKPGQDEELILGKFKSQDDLVRAYQEVESRLGQQGGEVGQLRQELAEMRGAINAQQTEPQYAPVDSETVTALTDLVGNGQGQQAAVWTLQYQPLLYERVMDEWYTSDPKGASRFEQQIQVAQVRQEMEQRLTSQVDPVAQTVNTDAQQRQFNEAWANTAQKYPDMAQHADSMMKVAETAPELVGSLMSGDQASKERLIENLYWLTKGQQADTLTQAAQTLGRQEADKARQEKLQGAVASGSSTQARGEKTPVEQWKDDFLKAPSTSITEGLREARR